jgi:hypothetical protein
MMMTEVAMIVTVMTKVTMIVMMTEVTMIVMMTEVTMIMMMIQVIIQIMMRNKVAIISTKIIKMTLIVIRGKHMYRTSNIRFPIFDSCQND